ncbi:hypothetical protein [Mesorhizobium sp. WSM3866]|uniref:hypothetical protein n=1 Tax=Mesorhizobium sp. WSM3866 TaxID=422271 RepID=UPI001140B44F|nr:hypothetical protein [Mesorhizobium sp. WSM3866]
MNKSIVMDSVEIDTLEDRYYVRVIEDGVVTIKGFGSEADAKAFAKHEHTRLGLDAVKQPGTGQKLRYGFPEG